MVELISVHIPKTAGSSFRSALAEIYKRQLVLDYGDGTPCLKNASVVHGHFPAAKYAGQFPKAKVIMWLRHPIDRIISYYHFWLRTPRHGNPSHDFFLDSKLSLMEFAEHELLRQEFANYLKDFSLDRFFFVGIMERYEEDLAKLSGELRLPGLSTKRENVSLKVFNVSALMRKQIAQLHRYEMEVYEHFLWR